MSEILYSQYRAFKQSLQQIQQIIHELMNESTKPSNPNQAALIAALSALQQLFKQEILPMPLDELPGEQISSVQSYRTEMHKQMRLLATDVMFLQTARQPTTKQQRRSAIATRVETLIGYCDALLQSD